MAPIRVTVRASRRTERYASLRRTSGSRSGSISSRAVARRIVPSVCTPPASSVSPGGGVNGLWVGISAQPPPPPAGRLVDRSEQTALVVHGEVRVLQGELL